MKHLLLLAVLFLGLTTPGWALDKVRISGTKKTLDKQESSVQSLPRGQTSLTRKQVAYTFSLQRMASDVSETSTVVWVLIKEQKDGRLVEAARGESEVAMPLGREVLLESTPVELEERDWSRPREAGSVSSQLAGYGLRVLNARGEAIAERYEPADLQRTIIWDKPADPAQKNIAELRKQIRDERRRQREQELEGEPRLK